VYTCAELLSDPSMFEGNVIVASRLQDEDAKGELKLARLSLNELILLILYHERRDRQNPASDFLIETRNNAVEALSQPEYSRTSWYYSPLPLSLPKEDYAKIVNQQPVVVAAIRNAVGELLDGMDSFYFPESILTEVNRKVSSLDIPPRIAFVPLYELDNIGPIFGATLCP
jgi:hypothetical protein